LTLREKAMLLRLFFTVLGYGAILMLRVMPVTTFHVLRFPAWLLTTVLISSFRIVLE